MLRPTSHRPSHPCERGRPLVASQHADDLYRLALRVGDVPQLALNVAAGGQAAIVVGGHDHDSENPRNGPPWLRRQLGP